MAWSFVGVSAIGTPVTATPIVLTEPAGVADGDLLIACIASRTTATTAITGTGWTAVGSQNNNNTLTTGSAVASGTMLYRIRSGTPTLSFTLPATVSVAMGQIVAYRGSAQTTPLDASTAVTAAAGLTPSVTGLTTTQADDLIVAMAAGGQEAAWSAFSNVGSSGVWNSADKSATITLSAGDKTATASSAAVIGVRSVKTYPNEVAGKYYAEFVLTSASGGTNVFAGIKSIASAMGSGSGAVLAAMGDQSVYSDNSVVISSGGAAYSVGDVACMAWDAGAERIWFRRNAGNWNNDAAANPATGTNGLSISALFSSSDTIALYGHLSFVSGSAVTIRTETAEFTQARPSGFAPWSPGGPLTASGATNTATAPSSTAWIERADNVTTSGADTSLGIFDCVRTGAGATGNLSATASVSAGHVIIAGAFKIAAASGATSVTIASAAGATGSVGAVTVSAKQTSSTTIASMPGATGSVGQVSVTAVQKVSPTISAMPGATGSVGQVSVTAKQASSTTIAAMPGATGSVGQATVTAKQASSTTIAAMPGATGSVGQVTVSAKQYATADVTGLGAVASVGSVTVTTGVSVPVSVSVTGIEATASVGSVAVTTGSATSSVSVNVTGLQATASVGAVTISGTVAPIEDSPTPPIRVIHVDGENRMVYAEGEQRSLQPFAGSKRVAANAGRKSFIAPAEARSVQHPAENNSVYSEV